MLLVSSSFKANKLYSSLVNLIPKEDIILFLENEMIRVEYISESREILANRIYSINSMIEGKHKIFILTPSSFYRFFPKKEEFLASCQEIKVNTKLNVQEFKEKLFQLGYLKVSKIDQSLQYATRGDIIDVFPINEENPIRIEFFDDYVESIRYFEIESQRSIKTLDKIKILPATSLIFSLDETNKIKDKIISQRDKDLEVLKEGKDEFIEQINEDLEDILNKNYSSRLYKYYGFLKESRTTPLDYLSNFETVILEKDNFLETRDNLYLESHELLFDLFNQGKSLSHLEIFNNNSTFINQNSSFNTYISSFALTNEDIKRIEISSNVIERNKMEFEKIVDYYLNNFKQIVFIVSQKDEEEKLTSYLNFLKEEVKVIKDLDDEFGSRVSIFNLSFNLGLEVKNESFALVPPSVVFSRKQVSMTYTSKYKEGVILGSYQDLEVGDFVVHEKYGIGKFLGIKEMEVLGKKSDYLEIQYEGNDTLLIPLYSFNLVRKYSGGEGKTPKLSKLYSNKWKKTKERIKNKVNDLADKLLELYKERALEEGYSFNSDDEIQQLFEEDFDHELTNDQRKSLKEIKYDMEQPHPMDRLLCGDVGFGKTEVAFCSAFKAISSGKQVLMISPTTLLTRQHYENALYRFRKFGVKIKILTRNEIPKEVKRIKEQLKNGEIDFLIGTHKALGKDVEFKNLGLLIIDEEQRFGVEQKENIKLRYKNIDVLTLSATPIPRTLQSSLIGLKSVSTIQTPPKERLPIQLYVIQKDLKVVKELIEREIARKGQVFYLHNNTFTIYELLEKLQTLMPDVRFQVIHGKMNKQEINDIMASFYVGEIDVLLTTTIIENGIDVRNANLIIVDNADRFGLSQLYQIKGRVGRSDKLAYCYLLIDRNKELTDEAKKRLKALQDFTELGSGYKIAQRDLLIRGAGEILGSEQAGFIDDVGIDLYLKLLNEALELKKNGIAKEGDEEEKKNQLQIKQDAYVPTSMAKDEEKIEIYQRIAEADTFEKLNELRKYISDLYGEKIPKSFLNVLKQRELDIYLSFDEFEETKNLGRSINLTLSKEFSNIPSVGSEIFMKLINYSSLIKISYIKKQVIIIIDTSKRKDIDDILLDILRNIHEIKEQHETR